MIRLDGTAFEIVGYCRQWVERQEMGTYSSAFGRRRRQSEHVPSATPCVHLLHVRVDK
ncbi:hypothetical protein WG66_001281 [Moniliophthora roreri]|nr:hypothetical protein WG66_001281 [Moniliophthora roreri]